MSTCTGLAGQCVTGDHWFHETAHIPVDGGELYVAHYQPGPVQLLLQTGYAVRSIGPAEALRLAGPAAPLLRPLLRLLPAAGAAAA